MTKRFVQVVRIIRASDGHEVGIALCRAHLPRADSREPLKVPDIQLEHIGYHPPFTEKEVVFQPLRLAFQLDAQDVWIDGEIDTVVLGEGPHEFIASGFSDNLRP